MPFSFIDVERRKSRTIGVVFFFLIFFYFLSAYLALFIFENIGYLVFLVYPRHGWNHPSGGHIFWILGLALVFALLHWWFSTRNLIARITEAIGASPADAKDEYHQYFSKIVEEVSVAIGGRKLEPWVVLSAGLNAFALEDFSGRAVIGITEGMLTRLNRRQIEAVVGHEAGHIASGDCLSTTVSSSISEIYETIVTRVVAGMRMARRFIIPLFFLYLVTATMKFLSNLIRFFISRQREYRADAISVRLTRDPLSLAEALKIITGNWHGANDVGSRLQSIFIINPEENVWDQREGFLANLFSTHPPVGARINILLDMAHSNERSLADDLKNFQRVSPVAVPEFKTPAEVVNPQWLVAQGAGWSAPLGVNEIKNLPGLKPDQWVKRVGGRRVTYAYNEPELLAIFADPQRAGQPLACPHCQTSLEDVTYEGARLLKCSYCEGILVDTEKISRILIRQDQKFSPEVNRLAQILFKSKLTNNISVYKNPRSAWIVNCPKCRQKMHRQFYVYSYPVELDQCVNCRLSWFEKDKLEILQYLYEHREEYFSDILSFSAAREVLAKKDNGEAE